MRGRCLGLWTARPNSLPVILAGTVWPPVRTAVGGARVVAIGVAFNEPEVVHLVQRAQSPVITHVPCVATRRTRTKGRAASRPAMRQDCSWSCRRPVCRRRRGDRKRLVIHLVSAGRPRRSCARREDCQQTNPHADAKHSPLRQPRPIGCPQSPASLLFPPLTRIRPIPPQFISDLRRRLKSRDLPFRRARCRPAKLRGWRRPVPDQPTSSRQWPRSS